DASITPKVVLDNFMKAVGGADAVKQVKTMALTGKTSIPGAPAPITITIKKAEGKFLQDVSMEGMGSVQKQVINGDKGYMSAQGAKQNLTADEIKDAKFDLAPFAEVLLMNASDATITGIEAVDGKDCYVLKAGDSSFFYEVATGLKLAEGKEVEMMGQKATQMTYYSDYKAVKGVKVPHRISQNVGFDLNITVTDVKINEGVS